MVFSPDTFLKNLPLPATEKWKDGVWYIEVYRHGTMQLEIFAPKNKDYQTPHEQDELYIIISGTSEFIKESEHYTCKVGDVIFVEAGRVHRFENFSDDFITWVIFYGPKGGETSV
ncbi:cupin domain-containing protein [Xanthocytophaga agilis]|uniref:Cupin domain-containing protein n=1 Tax=Xanthocytophaga agilis TaxID=3048010 RepID=A0AAE3UC77_9BACT|nr:cupin domain-containing protein [Xanthocytophaga agilis]MDJ1499051.1 cupin domain-containing protein [Xanthocytophaga agilis]